MVNDKYLTEPFKGYLTPKAKIVIEGLVKVGFDQDLALAFLESNYPDTEIYQLEEDADES